MSIASCCSTKALALLLLVLAVVLGSTVTSSLDNHNDNPYLLNEDSVVLITGAAGFVGSELAMALHRTYQPRKIICIDRMMPRKSSSNSAGGAADGSTASSTTSSSSSSSSLPLSQDDLARFEFKRQRAFHVMQTLGSSCVFYRANLEPSIPDYFDVGQVPILDHLVKQHGDISHIVHLASDHDDSSGSEYSGQQQVIPRHKEDLSAGMMETLLEQILQMAASRNDGRSSNGPRLPPPHFVYASSYQVYNFNHDKDKQHNPVPFEEAMPITTPSSMEGASKVIDELLVQAYFDEHHDDNAADSVFSSIVGLRLFDVYGPWGVPESDLYQVAEQAMMVSSNSASTSTGKQEQDPQDYNDNAVRDYVYVDDVVDAIMAAMQFQSPTKNQAPIVMNVGTGIGTSLQDVKAQMQDLFPSLATSTAAANKKKRTDDTASSVAYANIERAKVLLGYEPRVLLKEGLAKLLSWHYDRAFPYGGDGGLSSSSIASLSASLKLDETSVLAKRNAIASQGIASCSPYDKECLFGAPIFPCASECLHEAKCTSSMYDDVVGVVRVLTQSCKSVLYTVDLDVRLEAIPSANIAISTHHSSHLEDGCNVAFVSESSTLVQRLKREQSFSLTMTAVETFVKFSSNSGNKNYSKKNNADKPKVLKHGFWTLVPVSTPSFQTGDEHILALLPKLSPGLFFGPTTTHAIYCDPDVVFKDIPSLLQEAKMQPYRADTQGATAMLIARERGRGRTNVHDREDDDSPVTISASESIQNAAYRMVRIGVIDEMSGDGNNPVIDSSWVVHTLQKEDSRLFRCDVFGEVVQWDVGTDEKALEFIMGLHDMWSRVIETDNGTDPWWIGEGVVTVPEDYGNAASQAQQARRRLEQVDDSRTGANDNDRDTKKTNEDVKGEDEDDAVDDKVRGEDGSAGKEQSEQGDTDDIGDKDEATKDDGDTEVGEEAEDGANVAQEDTENEDEDTEESIEEDEQVDDDEEVDEEQEENESDDEEEQMEEKEEAFANKKGDQAAGVDKTVADQDQGAAGGAGAVDEQGQESNGFLNAGNDRIDVETQTDKGNQNLIDNEEVEQKDDDEINSTDEEEEDEEEEDEEEEDEEKKDGQAQVVSKQTENAPDRDHSSYDTWMGILSSTNVHYFVRIIPSAEVGATYLEDYTY